MSNSEQTAGEEQGDSNSGFNEQLKENKAAGEVHFARVLLLELGGYKHYVVVVNVCKEVWHSIWCTILKRLVF